MTYSNTRTAEGKSAPFLLLQFQVGPTLFYRYTDTENAKAYDGDSWEPATFAPEFPGEDGDMKEQTMKLAVQGDLTPALMLINRPPSFVCRVTVYEANLLDQNKEVRLRFAGRVISTKWSDAGTMEITVTPGSTELNLPGRPQIYMRTCGHVLYGPRCGATKTTRAMTGAVTDSGVIVLTGYPTGFIEAGAFSRGEISWTNPETGQIEYRTIGLCENNGSGLSVYVDYPPSGVTAFSIAMGCTHTEAACMDWHNNILNYGGQPWIPLESPHNRYTEFY